MEITMPAPVDTVWTAFRDPAVIRRWFGWDYDGLDDEIRVVFFDETVASEAEHTLRIGDHLFGLHDHGPQTVVRVTRTGDTESDAFYDDVEEGWLSFLHQLRFVLARHPDQSRHSIYRNGEALASSPLPAYRLLGLGEIGNDGRYAIKTAVGDMLSGEVWYRSDLQLGLTVDEWGDGLLLLAQSPSVRPPHGAASIFLCAYGVDAAFMAISNPDGPPGGTTISGAVPRTVPSRGRLAGHIRTRSRPAHSVARNVGTPCQARGCHPTQGPPRTALMSGTSRGAPARRRRIKRLSRPPKCLNPACRPNVCLVQ